MVSLLSNQIDRLAHSTRAISAIGTFTATPVAGPFTRAVLSTRLGDLIRDIDSSELGLFSLQSAAEPQITRVEFDGATPLRQTSSRRAAPQKPKEAEPEVYARAAIKCINRYQNIRPMPRAYSQALEILEASAATRENIEKLNKVLQQAQSSESHSLKLLIGEEEGRISAFQERIHHLHQNKKHAKAIQVNPPPKESTPTPIGWTFQPPTALPQEGCVEDTPPSRSRVLQFTDNLLDEEVDLADISAASFTSPYTSRTTKNLDPPLVNDDDHLVHTHLTSLETIQEREYNYRNDPRNTAGHTADQAHYLSPGRSPVNSASVASLDSHQTISQKPLAKPSTLVETIRIGQTHIQLNGEVERIMTRVWVTVGDTLLPRSDTSDGQYPGPQETITRLQLLSALSPNVPQMLTVDPTHPTYQQILTAHLIVSLLASPPHFSLSLGNVKHILASKAKAHASASATAQTTSRILYGCVAKRLLKIERGGGEQIVEFDIP